MPVIEKFCCPDTQLDIRPDIQLASSPIAPCIACNQACLDHTFKGQISSCLVNPRACFERELELKIVSDSKNIGIVGGGPAGLSAAITAAQIGHQVTVYEKEDELGGQLNLAKNIPISSKNVLRRASTANSLSLSKSLSPLQKSSYERIQCLP